MMQRTQSHSHLYLSIALLMVTITLTDPVLLWVQILVVCAVTMRGALFFDLQKHLPSVRTVNLLALLSALVLAYSGWHLGLLLGMLNLLVMACALKLMMMRKHRDYFRLITSCLFLVGCGFIFQQSITMSMLYGVVVLLLLISLAYHINPAAHWQKQFKRIGIQSLQAVPIGILLFLVIPKIEPLWNMPSAKSAETGLSEKVTPGDIANLSQSTELAFRATFDTDIPTMQSRYWRAIVLEEFDGKTWSISPRRKTSKRYNYQLKNRFDPRLSGPFFEYEVIAEPTHQPWLYALDVANSYHKELWVGRDYQLQRIKPLQSQFKYRVRSYYQNNLDEGIPDLDQTLNLKLPDNGNPRTRDWVKSIRTQFPNDIEFINKVAEHFANGGYQYTLRPSAMPHNPVDQFLFDDKAGFCAHYAGAMTLVMRLAGIPARMVTGYLGGEMRGDEYMSVYQYDAHAWVEVWQNDIGWVRYDPTALAAPDRLLYGLEEAVAYENSFLSESPFALAKLKNIAWLNELRGLMEDADYLWSRWLLGFDQQKQLDLFESIIGNLSPYRIAGLTIGVMLFIGFLLALFHIRIWFPKIEDPLLHYYQSLLITLKKQGITKPAGMAANDFISVVKSYAKPACSRHFQELTQEFVRLRYQAALVTPEQLTLFEKQVKQFNRQYR